MKEQIEIYVRKSGARNLLHLHVPASLKPQFIRGLEEDGFGDEDVDIHPEMRVLPEYLAGEPENHVRLKLDRISLISSDQVGDDA